MKILVIQETNWPERYPHTQHHLMERLVLKGHEVRVIDFDFDWKRNNTSSIFKRKVIFQDVSKIMKDATIQVIRPSAINLPLIDYIFLLFSSKKELENQIIDFKPDIIMGFGILNAYTSARLASKYNIPFIYYWIDLLDSLIPEKRLQSLGRFIEAKTIQLSNKVFVTNEKLKDYVISLGAEENKISIFSSGIDFTHFHAETDGSRIRKQYGLSEEDVVLFFMGWIYHFSGLKEVVQTLVDNRDTHPEVKLLVVGEGDAYEELCVLRDQHNLESRLILPGRQSYESLPEFIAASDVCILPAYTDEKTMQDIVPIKLFEYLAMGKPVICTKLPGVMKEFQEENGIVYVDKPEDTVGAAKNLCASDQGRNLGLQGRIFVSKYDWNVISDRFEECLGDTIMKHSKKFHSTRSDK